MPVFQFNRNTNSLNLLGNDRGILPRVGINFGNSRLARTIGGLFTGGGERKGHPGSAGQVVGEGVRTFNNLFRGRLFGGDSIDAISVKKWPYENTKYSSKSHPPGFTPPYAFLNKKNGGRSKTWRPFEKYGINTEIEITRGQQPMAFRPESFGDNYLLTIPKTLDYRKDILGKRDPRTKKFSFGLNENSRVLEIDHVFKKISDNDLETHAGLQSPKDVIPLQSFTNTITGNEDPTILGFDIEIDEVTSPLFNGSIIDFINKYGSGENSISEISSRKEIYNEFVAQFKKFFQTNVNFLQNTESNNSIKNYYITQITGIEKFSHVKGEESGTDGPKLFTNFPIDKIDLSMNEDVEQNISYLSYLYNTLSRSRIEGRRIIPQNLLRFNCRIIISEVRNYNRVVKESLRIPSRDDRYKVINDLISKKEYNLYECEFFFNKLTHGNQIRLNEQPTPVSNFSISFNYKFVSSEFHKFNFDGNKDPYFTKTRYNDEFIDPKQLTSLDTGRALIARQDTLNESFENTGQISESLRSLSSISFLDPIQTTIEIDKYPKSGYPLNDRDRSPLGRANLRNLANTFVGGLVRNLVGNVVRAGADAINREISSRFNLVNKAINERLGRLGLQISLNTIQNPRNVYNPGNRLRNELSNAVRGFVGRSLGRFFSRPINTSEANNGFLPQRQGGPFRKTSIYRPTASRTISRLRASQITAPRNIYVRRRIGSFLGNTNSRQIPASRIPQSANSSTRVNPFVSNLSPSSSSSQRGTSL